MKKFDIEDVLNQRRPLVHTMILLFSLAAVGFNVYANKGSGSWQSYLGGLVLIFTQIELFIFLARLVFKNVRPGRTPMEITRIALFRFIIFLTACFVVAFILVIVFSFIRQYLAGGDLTQVLPDFFTYSFSTWYKSTIGGLLFGAAIFIVVLWQDALRREQKLREENLVFQHETLKHQVNPHFLFNSLNTLSSLIASRPEVAEEFISRLSSIYRYILDNGSRDKVPLNEELSFITDYFYLHRIRDDGKIELEIQAADPEKYAILPVSLQILVENAIKHNRATRENPLKIDIFIEGQQIIVKNNLQKMASGIRSTGIGLKNLAQRVKLVLGKELSIEETVASFVVKVPLFT